MSTLIVLGTLIGITVAQAGPDSFLVEVNPSSFQVNQPVDMTITALKSGVPYTSYTGMIYMNINGLLVSERVLPNRGRVEFKPSDLGKITLSKGLEIKKAGEYSLSVNNFEETLFGSTKITVINPNSNTSLKTIDIISPIPNTTESSDTVFVYAKATDLPNSLAQIYLNGILVNDMITVDSQGGIEYTLGGLRVGINTLFITITSLTDQELGRSETVSFIYEPVSDQLLKGITLTPNTNLRIGDRVQFEVTTDPAVNSAKLIFSNGQPPLVLDKDADGVFSRTTTLITSGQISLDVELVAIGQSKTFSGNTTYFVDDSPEIRNVKFQVDPQNPKYLHISRQLVGAEASGYNILYGLAKDTLSNQTTTSGTSVIFQIEPKKTYYFKIIPLIGTGEEHGSATDIYTYDPAIPLDARDDPIIVGTGPIVVIEPIHSLCIIKGIRVTTEKIGRKTYLVRDSVKNATSYTLYMSDEKDPDTKKKLLDTKETRYEYPFDYSSEVDIYAYFRVEATCDDGQVMELAGAKKVQV
ncbi:MAG: hypothetical protein LBD11_04935 [Candidatus Peribacteria bacterium]|nr:hypothetical protein [Candidatus Peribacteria bacterium]